MAAIEAVPIYKPEVAKAPISKTVETAKPVSRPLALPVPPNHGKDVALYNSFYLMFTWFCGDDRL